MLNIKVVDSTLREGEQAAYVYFSLEQKLKIVQLLTELNVDEIELGVCVGNPDIDKLISMARGITSSRLALWCRLRRGDIEEGLVLNPDVLSVSIPVSDLHIYKKLRKTPEELLSLVESELTWLRANTDAYISVGLEDATRARPDFLLKVSKLIEDCGADRIRLADTLGILDPVTAFNLITALKKELSMDIGVHTHNDFGMASANAISAVMAGADYVDVTVCGLGERAGNAALEQVMAFAVKRGDVTRYNLKILKKLCHFVAEAACYPVSPKQPVIGDEIFTCESGIHIDGILKSADTYEPFLPDEFGHSRRFVIGKKTGKKAVEAKLKELGILIEQGRLESIFKEVKQTSAHLNRCLTDEELKSIAVSA